ncbi:AraC family transcriptional regulator [Leptospira sp. 201903071]|uniref:helix-turn-helix domain-containing protein n=1 Tax=Leptospira ainazelensis TaxID=2810034 RepID=UPI0019645FAC|nr:helix-turn-helix domain-containing protein [Leptospira ainazelensis]MBM9500137.1 AraC family transcriptional regulator [Leptospira ainazelensis]
MKQNDSISYQIDSAQTLVLISAFGILLSSEPLLFLVFGLSLLANRKWIFSFLEIQNSYLAVFDKADRKNEKFEFLEKTFVSENISIPEKKNPFLEGLDLEQQKEKLERLMTEERLFLDEELRLPSLAEEMKLSLHCLSALLNEVIGKSFNEFVNGFRIEEAKQMLIEEEDRSVLSIGLAVGFNSYSAFLRSFIKFEGITPKKFKKEQREHLKKNVLSS